MFRNIYDIICLLWAWHWPVVQGEVTAVEIERFEHNLFYEHETARLAVAYKFSVGDDGPYAGECFWSPAFFPNKRIAVARRRLHLRQPVQVRYRPDDPSVNTLNGGVRALLKQLAH